MRKVLLAAMIPFAALLLPAAPAKAALTENDIGNRVVEAQRMIGSRPDLAAEKLAQLLEEQPGQPHLRFLYAQALSRLERFEEAESLLLELKLESPRSRGVISELAHLHLRLGREDEAEEVLDGLLAGRPNARSFRDVAAIYQSADRFDLAERTYRRGLEILPEEDEVGRVQLLRQLISEYELGSRGDAILRLMAIPRRWRQPDLERDLLRAADRAFRDMEDCEEFTELADSLSATPEGARLAPLLRWVYLRAERLDDYLAESLRAHEGEPVDRMNFLRQEARRHVGRPRLARPLWRALTEGDYDSRRANEARLALIDLDLAEDARRRLVGEEPDPGLAGRLAALRAEDLGPDTNLDLVLREQKYLRESLGDAETAETVLREILVEPRRRIRTSELWRLELELGRDLLARGDLPGAMRLFESVEAAFPPRRRPTDPDRRWLERESIRRRARLEAGYHRACIAAVTEDPAAAQDSLAALAKENPASGLANDALATALLLAEAAEWPEALGEILRRSLALEMRFRPADAADLLLPFVEEFPEDEATPVLLYRMGRLREKALEGRAALENWERLADDFPDHHRAAPALDRAARLAWRMGETERARRLLGRLLDEYPESSLIPGLRELRGELEENA